MLRHIFILFFTSCVCFSAYAELPVNSHATQQQASDNEVAVYGADSGVTQVMSEVEALSKDIQNLKLEVVDLNSDLRQLEENLLFPSGTKYSFFVSLKTGEFFTLESIKLKVDGKWVATHLYDDDNRQALSRGGVQKIYVTNLSEGKHAATAFFTGLGPNGRTYKRATDIDFKKNVGEGFMEIAISDDGSIQEPVFTLKQW